MSDREETANAESSSPSPDEPSIEELRRRVEETYDFENFSEADMAEMSVEEWSAVFDPDSWITGDALIDRVDRDLRARVDRREFFAVIERVTVDGTDCVLAYTDSGYALVRPDGSVDGEGSIRVDIEPVVALCAMEEYTVPESVTDNPLPNPNEITAGTGELGNRLIQVIAGVQVVAGIGLLIAPLVITLPTSSAAGITTVMGLIFLVIGIGIFLLVANARLSDRFRAEDYRNRLRAAGVGSESRPEFLPPIDESDDDAV